jgi:hypothetical protein
MRLQLITQINAYLETSTIYVYVVTAIHLYLTERQMASYRGTWWIGGGGGLLTMARSSAAEEPHTTPYHLNKSIGCEHLVLSAVLSSVSEQIQAISVARCNPRLSEVCPVMSLNTLLHCYKAGDTIEVIASSYIAFLRFVYLMAQCTDTDSGVCS